MNDQTLQAESDPFADDFDLDDSDREPMGEPYDSTVASVEAHYLVD